MTQEITGNGNNMSEANTASDAPAPVEEQLEGVEEQLQEQLEGQPPLVLETIHQTPILLDAIISELVVPLPEIVPGSEVSSSTCTEADVVSPAPPPAPVNLEERCAQLERQVR